MRLAILLYATFKFDGSLGLRQGLQLCHLGLFLTHIRQVCCCQLASLRNYRLSEAQVFGHNLSRAFSSSIVWQLDIYERLVLDIGYFDLKKKTTCPNLAKC